MVDQRFSELSTTDNYEEVELIGSGAFGTVYKARDLNNPGQLVALKKIRVPQTNQGIDANLLREIVLLKQIQHCCSPFVVKLLDVCLGKQGDSISRPTSIYLVFEHIDMDLATYLNRCPAPGLGPDMIKRIAYQLLKGVDFLHTHRIVHRDLKPQNVLITNTGVVKVADFGLARIYGEQILTSVVVTLWYRAPEVLLQYSYNSTIDIWSCGCILFELYARRPLFPGMSESDQLRLIFEVIGAPKEDEWPPNVLVSWDTFAKSKPTPLTELVPEICPEAVSLLQQMFKFDLKKRICAKDALSHEFFKEYEMYPPNFDERPAINLINLENSSTSSSISPSTQNTQTLINSNGGCNGRSSGGSSLESSSPSFDSLNGNMLSGRQLSPGQLNNAAFLTSLESPGQLLSLSAHESMPSSNSPFTPRPARRLINSSLSKPQ